MRNLAKSLCMLTLAIVSFPRVSSQEIGASIRGTLLDPSGGVISGAKVTATQIETGLIRSVFADSQGNYVLVELPVGHYRLEVEAKGFQKYIREGISLDVNQTATLTMQLSIGMSTEEISCARKCVSARRGRLQPWQDCAGA